MSILTKNNSKLNPLNNFILLFPMQFRLPSLSLRWCFLHKLFALSSWVQDFLVRILDGVQVLQLSFFRSVLLAYWAFLYFVEVWWTIHRLRMVLFVVVVQCIQGFFFIELAGFLGVQLVELLLARCRCFFLFSHYLVANKSIYCSRGIETYSWQGLTSLLM